MLPLSVTVPTPVLVKANAPPISPESAKLPVPPTVASAVKVMAPPRAAPAPVPSNAPAKLRASAPMATLLISSTAPLAKVVPNAVLPSADAWAAIRLPLLTVVVPV